MTRPNVLLIYTDQQRADALGAAGNDQIHTPHLDALAASGTLFAKHFVQNPLCMPSRISMLSGRYPATLGITHMGVPVPESIPTLATHLARSGYHCANIGKLHFLPHANRDHREPHPAYDFDQLQISEEPGVYEDAYWAWLRARCADVPVAPTTPLPPARATWNGLMGAESSANSGRDDYDTITPFAFDDDLTHSAFVADQTIEYLAARRRGGPFLCIAGFFSPHAPYIVPRRFIDLYDDSLVPPELATCGDETKCRRATHGYYAAVSEVDHHVGRIMDALDENGLRDDTIVVFTSDHGDWLGNSGRYAKGYPGDDPVSQVPFVVAGPGIAQDSKVVEITESVDIVPTLLETCGLQVPGSLQGRVLTPVLRGAAPATPWDAITEGSGWMNLRTDTHRYLVHADGTDELVDVTTDDDAGGDDEAKAEHRSRLLSRILARQRPLPRTYAY